MKKNETITLEPANERCYICGNRYLDDVAIPSKELSKKIKEYNYKKINYIGKHNS